MICSEAGSVGFLAVLVSGRPGHRWDKGESGDGVRQRGGTIWVGSGAGRDTGPGLKAGRTKAAT